LILTLALLVAGASPNTSKIGPLQYLTAIVALASGPLLLLAFAPPPWVVAIWRRKDEAALRDAQIALVTAVTPADVARLLLPCLSASMGGHGAVLYRHDGSIAGAHGVEADRAATLHRGVGGGRYELETGQVIEIAEFSRGCLAVLRSAIAPIFGSDDRKTLQAIAAMTDMALARADLFDRERRNVEAMRDFVAIASHDLRTPITVIGGIGSLVSRRWHELSDDERFDLVVRVEKHAAHLARIVDDLLTVSKVDAGVLELSRDPLDLYEAATEVVAEYGERAGSIRMEVPVGVTVEGDSDYLRRMLRNYISNAFNHGAEPITIAAAEAGNCIELRVSDHGPGVPPEFIPRLFEKFARADKKMSRATQGTGLGLSIVHGLASAMGGEAFYEPNTPCGATFGVRLKRAAS
jgi:signal transduction histidine kinase